MTAITVILLSYCDVKKCRRRVCCCGLDVVPSFGDRPTTHCTHMANPNVLLQMLFFILTSLSLGVNFVDYTLTLLLTETRSRIGLSSFMNSHYYYWRFVHNNCVCV